MTASYAGLRSVQRQRHDVLIQLRQEMGDRAFSEFLIDALTETGPTLSVADLPSLAVVWQTKQHLRRAA